MDTEQNIKENIIRRAEILLHYNNLLIEQCDNWLTEEESHAVEKKNIK